MDKVRYTSSFYYNLTRWGWTAVFLASLLAASLTLPSDVSSTTTADDLPLAILTVVTLILLPRNTTFGAVAAVEKTRAKLVKIKNRYQKTLFVLIGLSALADFGLRVSRLSHAGTGLDVKIVVLAVVALAVIGVVSFRTLQKNMEEKKKIEIERDRNPFRWVEAQNFKIFLIAGAPIVSAALLVLFSTVALRHSHSLIYWSYYVVGLSALLASCPPREFFIVACRRCGATTSRALESYRICPRCSPHLFFKREDVQIGSTKKQPLRKSKVKPAR